MLTLLNHQQPVMLSLLNHQQPVMVSLSNHLTAKARVFTNLKLINHHAELIEPSATRHGELVEPSVNEYIN
jgi:hypothetical protein